MNIIKVSLMVLMIFILIVVLANPYKYNKSLYSNPNFRKSISLTKHF